MALDWSFLREFRPADGVALQTQLAVFLRRAIESGRIAPGTRLPPLRQLAELCGVNYFSLQLATEELMYGGLLCKQRGRGGGISVPPRVRRHEVIALLQIDDERTGEINIFENAVVHALTGRLEELGYRSVIYQDKRPCSARTVLYPMLAEALCAGQVQGVIGLSVPSEARGWFAQLPVPHTAMSDPFFQGGRYDGARGEVRPLLELLRTRSFRNPFWLGSFHSPRSCSLLGELAAAGFQPQPEQLRLIHGCDSRIQMASWGYRTARELLRRPQPPDLLVVHPDPIAQGVAQAVLESGIRVPEELTLVFHRNLELAAFFPFPVIYLDVSVRRVADQLIHQLTPALHSETTSSTR